MNNMVAGAEHVLECLYFDFSFASITRGEVMIPRKGEARISHLPP